MNARLALAALTALTLTCSSSWAYVVVDQESPTYSSFFDWVSSNVGQSFQQTGTTVAGAGVKIGSDPYAGPGTSVSVTISLWSAQPYSGNSPLTAGSVSLITEIEPIWADVFWNPVDVQPNTTYFLTVSGPPSTVPVLIDFAGPYSLGMAFGPNGSPAYRYYDMAFRTFAASVPEPSSLALVLSGFLSIASLSSLKLRRGGKTRKRLI